MINLFIVDLENDSDGCVSVEHLVQYLFAISSQSTENAGDFITKMLATAYSCNCNHTFNGNLCLMINLLNSIAINCTIFQQTRITICLSSPFIYTTNS